MKILAAIVLATLFYWSAFPDLNHEAYCLFWNPSGETFTVLADFYIDGNHYTRHDGILYPWVSVSTPLKTVIPDLPFVPYTLVLTAPNLFYSWCWNG